MDRTGIYMLLQINKKLNHTSSLSKCMVNQNKKIPQLSRFVVNFPNCKGPDHCPKVLKKPQWMFSLCVTVISENLPFSITCINVFYSSDMQIMYSHLCGRLYSMKWVLC